jgi:hypothetical protein
MQYTVRYRCTYSYTISVEYPDPDPYMFLGLPDPDPLVRGTDPDLVPAPDPFIIKQKQ